MLSYQNLQIFNILQGIFIVVIIVLNARIHNKLVDENDILLDRIEELEKVK